VRRQLLRFGRAYLPWLSLGETERARDKQNQKRRQGSWLRIFREGVKERALLFLLLHTLLNEFAVVHQFADQGIDLLQAQWSLRMSFQIAAHEAIFVHLQFEGGGAGFLDGGQSELLGQGQHSQNAAYPRLSFPAMDGLAESADMRARPFRSRQQLLSAERCEIQKTSELGIRQRPIGPHNPCRDVCRNAWCEKSAR
jgi:hypothetical protein